MYIYMYIYFDVHFSHPGASETEDRLAACAKLCKLCFLPTEERSCLLQDEHEEPVRLNIYDLGKSNTVP